MSSKRIWQQIKYIAILLLGNALMAFEVAAFIIPHGIITGGATGIGIVMNTYLGVDTAVVVLIFNVLMLILGGFALGKKFLLSTVAGSLLYPFFLALFQRIPGINILTDNTLLAALFAGGILGVSLGMLVRIGSSTGGMDVLNLVTHKWFHIPFATTVYISDLIVLGGQALFSEPEQILFGILVIVVETYFLDYVMITGQAQLQLFVVSELYDIIRDSLLKELEAGVTMMEIETGISRNKQQGVLCVIPKRKLHTASKLIQAIDPNAFMTVTQIKEVRGQGFTRERLHRTPAENIKVCDNPHSL